MGGLGVNTFYNIAVGLTMGAGRFAVIVPTLALAGALAAKPRNDVRGTLRTDTVLFAGLLLSVVIVVGALTFLPADALGPVYEAVAQHGGRTF
jgi:K+-transporting ATPase ATPase A chain